MQSNIRKKRNRRQGAFWRYLRDHRFFNEKTKNPDDRRGKHTKQQRLEAKKEAAEQYARLHVDDSSVFCHNCSAPSTSFVPSSDDDCLVCCQCGATQDDNNIVDTRTFTSVSNRTTCYRHCNYFSERLKQATNTEPGFTRDELCQIKGVFNSFKDQNPLLWNQTTFCKTRFGTICKLLNVIDPNEKWVQKQERWFQAMEFLFGPVDNYFLIDSTSETLLKNLYEIVTLVFVYFIKDKEERHNMPNIDLVVLILLYNMPQEALERHGWYFLSPKIYWEDQSIAKSYRLVQLIIDAINEKTYTDNRWKYDMTDKQSDMLRNLEHLDCPSIAELKKIVMANPLARNLIYAENSVLIEKKKKIL